MRSTKWLVAAGLVMVTAGCVEQSGYPTTYGYSPGYTTPSYGYSNYRYANQPTYYSQPSYYRPAPTYYQAPRVVTRTRYVPVPVSQPSYRRMRDWNGDGIPDKYQRRRNWD